MKTRALVAEDDEKWQKIFQRNIEKASIECNIAENYLIAKEMLPKNHYNIALLDIGLHQDDHGNQDGLRIASHIYRNDPDTAILIVTGRGTVKITRDALKEYAAVDVLAKEEFDFKEFSLIAKELLEVNNKRLSKIDVNYVSLLKNDYIESFQLDYDLRTVLKPDGGNLDAILNKFIRPLSPILRHRSHAGLYNKGNGFYGVFWSRSVGKAILLSLLSGKNRKINPEEAKKIVPLLESGDVEQILVEDSKLNVSVQVCSVSGINFEDFESKYSFL